MNNLKPQINDSIISSKLLIGVTCLTIDTDLNVIYCVNKEKQLISIDINKNLINSCCALSVSDHSIDAICVEFLSEERCVCIALTNGHLINYNIITNNQQFVGSLSDGLQSVSFSFDQELIVLLTQKNSLILMNKLFDVLAERDLNTEDFGVHKAVTVNWGSKSTQFHGKGQRDFRDDKQDLQTSRDSDDLKSRISWRGDGLYFVTSSFDSKTKNRKLQVWSRDAILQYSSEFVSGLEHLISWRPSGSLIASSRILPNKHMIIFFEKNGLKHGEFELPFIPNTFEVKLILWSFDSEILLILGSESVGEVSKQVLMLWRQSNYHWYLKQCLKFTDEVIMNAIWDPIDRTVLHIILSNGEYVKYRWKWSVDISEGKVGLIDGKSLKISNFDESVIPPPFCSYSLDFKSQVVDICFSKSTLAVILSDDTILLFENTPKVKINDSNYFSVSFENSNQENTFECFYINSCEGIAKLTNLFICKSNIIYGINSNELVAFDFRNEVPKIDRISNLNSKVIGMNSWDNIVAIVGIDGKLMKMDTNTRDITEWTDKNDNPVIFPQQALQLELFKLEDRIISICLSENYTLYLDNEVLSQNNCNSFIKFNDRFLLFSTTDHLLHCWPLNENIFNINKNYQIFSPRSVERGSKIIAASNSDAKIILQMPRGNLEAIHPRMLLLDSIMLRLDRLQFDLAFELLRKHRINLNFLCDYNPENFNNNIELFITQIGEKSVEWICLFLTDLSNEDLYVKLCSNGIISHRINLSSIDESDKSSNKIDIICDSMRACMDKLDSNKYLHPILLTYIKKSAPETDLALKRIKGIEDSSIRDEAIKFLLYIININTLFEEALGTYDFEILLMIASKSQKDPKEYLALMEELNAYESFDYKCYKIDLYLKRYKRALTHLQKCDQHFEECIELIRAHSLYKDAILLYQTSPEEQKNRIWKLYGDYLMNKKYFEEAAIAYKRCNDFVNAVKVYQLSGNWNGAIDAAFHCSDVINNQTLARNLAKHLISIGKHCDASYLFEVYAKDPKEGMKTLIAGHEWEHAARLLNQYTDDADVHQFLRSELKNHFESTLDIITTNYQNLFKYKNRLETVRLNKIEKNLDLNSFDNFDHKSDIYSDTSSLSESNSIGQRSTSSSLATRKTKRITKKLEKRKYILKEGSADEDIQLIFAINEIIKITDRMQEEVSLLIRTLYDFYFIEESNKIQIEFSVLIDLINILIKNIWPQNDQQNQLNDFSQRYQITDPELSKAPDFRKTDWKLALI